jgi:hypothetical protein
MPTLLQTGALPAAMLAAVSLSTRWHMLVSRHVPEPYLVGPHMQDGSQSTHEVAGRILPCTSGSVVLQRRLHMGPQDHNTARPVSGHCLFQIMNE